MAEQKGWVFLWSPAQSVYLVTKTQQQNRKSASIILSQDATSSIMLGFNQVTGLTYFLASSSYFLEKPEDQLHALTSWLALRKFGLLGRERISMQTQPIREKDALEMATVPGSTMSLVWGLLLTWRKVSVVWRRGEYCLKLRLGGL